MSLLEQFREGRDAQKKHSRIQQMKRPAFKGKKFPPWHPGQILRGAGIVWEMLSPVTGMVERAYHNNVTATANVIRNDIQSLKNKLQKKYGDPNYERYSQFVDLCEGRK